MDNNGTFTTTRTHLIWAVCLPLAILIGYLLADPLDASSIAVFALLAGVLSVPLLLRWHHPLLVVTWNAAMAPYFFPATTSLWMLFALVGFGVGVLNRATSSQYRFIVPPSIAIPAILLGLVALFTAQWTGGIGLRSLGSDTYGGRAYFHIALAIIGLFALTTQQIPLPRANLYVFLFFLGGLTLAAGNFIYMLGPVAYPLFAVFPATHAVGQAASETNLLSQNQVRIGGFGLASAAVICAVLAVHGFRGALNWKRPWRGALIVGALAMGTYSGFRSALLLSLMILGIMFLMEGWREKRILLVGAAAGALLLTAFLPFVSHLPLVVQRSLSFLPVEVHPAVRQDAQNSIEWRVEMWRDVLPELPRRVLWGRGYAIDANEMHMSIHSAWRGLGNRWGASSLAGDYHNGPLSLMIPLGGVGLGLFAWLLISGGRALYRNYRFGNPAFANLNRFIYAYFLVRIVYFVLVFGSFYLDLFVFTGLIGLSLSLNGGVARPAPPTDDAEEELA